MADGDFHVVPQHDLREHIISPNCWCRPVRDTEERNVWVHMSADDRESYENGRKLH